MLNETIMSCFESIINLQKFPQFKNKVIGPYVHSLDVMMFAHGMFLMGKQCRIVNIWQKINELSGAGVRLSLLNGLRDNLFTIKPDGMVKYKQPTGGNG